MTIADKKAIKECLTKYVSKYESQSAASNSLTSISSATISQVLNDNWKNISDGMWRKIAKQCCFKDYEWQIAETSVYTKLTTYFKVEQLSPNGIRSLSIKSSLGKSTTIKRYTENNSSAYYVQCYRKMRSGDVLREILKSMGKVSSGSYHEMLGNMIHYLERDSDPLIIVDEVDKLDDRELQMFIDLENKLNGKCGLVFLSTEWFLTKMERGVAANRQGFAELWSRMRKQVKDLTPTALEFRKDLILIANLNGITDDETITNIYNNCVNDLRVAADLINAHKNLLKKAS